jgi:hypothetical protein
MRNKRFLVNRREDWEKMVREAEEEAYDLLNSEKRRA